MRSPADAVRRRLGAPAPGESTVVALASGLASVLTSALASVCISAGAADVAGGVPAPAAESSAMATTASAPAAPITPERVREVVGQLRADPAFARSRAERSLRWKDADAARAEPASPPAWLMNLVRWLAEAGRGLVWLLAAVAVALVAVFAWRWASVRAGVARARTGLLPSHVNDLDIRPESLPDDIAAAARAHWQRGQARAALSLLYRGALSRLVHGHGAEIGAASTEGECVVIAGPLLAPDAAAFFARLVQAWQTVVYAGREPAAAEIGALCDGFDRHIARVAAPDAAALSQQAGAAA